jgi:hypothetical protein
VFFRWHCLQFGFFIVGALTLAFGKWNMGDVQEGIEVMRALVMLVLQAQFAINYKIILDCLGKAFRISY